MMDKKGLFFLLYFLLLNVLESVSVQAQVPFVCEGQLYLALEEEGHQRLIELRIDPFTQDIDFVPINNSVDGIINGMGYRRTDNLIYGVDPNNDGPNGHYLERLDATGAIEILSRLPLRPSYGYYAGDVTPDGRFLILVGVDRHGVGVSDFVRVDLDDPNYSIRSHPMEALLNIFDIAFDPLSGALYAYDSANGQLMTLDPNDGTVLSRINTNNIVGEIAGLFFNAFGDLFGYGGVEMNNTLLRIDKDSGFISKLLEGPSVRNADATSCPFTIDMIKEVSPNRTVPCQEVIYTFSIANGSGDLQSGILFRDQMPGEFTIKELLRNPYPGDVVISADRRSIEIHDMEIPPGVDSIKLVVEVNDTKDGIYANQSALSGLVRELGEIRVSDDPATLVEDDSTTLEIFGSPVPDTLYIDYQICKGDVLFLDGTMYGDRYRWSTGEQTGVIRVESGGVYELIGERDCDTNVIRYRVSADYINVTIPDSVVFLRLGEAYTVHPILSNSQEFFTARWNIVDTTQVQCPRCLSTTIRPLANEVFELTVQNEAGCVDTAMLRFRVDRTRKVYIPNVFTPNGDGSNDRFYAQSPDFGHIVKMLIFNRWGGIVFESNTARFNDPRSGWDGSYRGVELDPAVFAYLIEVEFLDGVRKIYSGDLTLLR